MGVKPVLVAYITYEKAIRVGIACMRMWDDAERYVDHRLRSCAHRLAEQAVSDDYVATAINA